MLDSTHFDRLTIALGRRRSRRNAIALGTAGLTTLGLAPRAPQVSAQDATPAPQSATPTTIYVQLADSGSWTPKPDEPGIYLLTLFDPGDQTIAFTMAPDRFVASMPTDVLLDTLGFTPEFPPNAAIEVVTPDGERDVLVVTLMNPTLVQGTDEGDPNVLTYEAQVLKAYKGAALEEWLPDVEDDQLPTQFEQVSLFIDNGCWGFTGCYVIEADGSRGERVGDVPATPNLMRCPGFEPDTCVPCGGNSIETLHARCNSYYPACNQRCIAD